MERDILDALNRGGLTYLAQLIEEKVAAQGSQNPELRAKLEQQDALLRQFAEGAHLVGYVVTVDSTGDGKSRGTYIVSGNILSGNLPAGAVPGSRIRVIAKTSQPYDVIPGNSDVGEVCTVTAVHGDALEIQVNSGTKTVARGMLIVEPGQRVIVDRAHHVALRVLPATEDSYSFDAETSVSWDDIGGLDDAKEAIREAIEFPTKFAALYSGYSQTQSKGVLLEGPPGCGKTMLGKATFTAMAGIQGGGRGGFIYVKGPEVLSQWVGAAEATIRGLFQQARAYKARTGSSAVIFIDEAEALLSTRDTDGFRGGIQQTLVPAFLAEMDGLVDSGAFVMLATNRASSLDSAVTRDGRIDRKVQVRRPDREQSLAIFELALRGRPTSVENLASVARDAAFASNIPVATGALNGAHVHLLLADVMSGAMAAGIVRRATAAAIRRDRLSGAEQASGITREDVLDAVASAARESQNLDWRADLIAKASTVVSAAVINQGAKAHSEAN